MLGMMILVSSDNFLSLYLGLELLALPIYALIAISKQYRNSSEAAMKYFVMGAMASGLLLYGVSLLYGGSGGLEFHTIAREFLGQAGTPNLALQFGMIFVLAGVAFKLGAVPFHMWLPDVYQGAPIPVTMFIGTAPKIAAFGMTIRILINVFPENVSDWQMLLSFMAVLSLIIGNLAAIMQTNIKRLLAYSTISHMGFILLGIISGAVSGITPSMFYVISYVMVVLATFGLISALSKNGLEVEKINDLKGLGKKSPYISLLLLIVLFSLAGIPPTIGFYAKLFVLNSLLEQGNIGLAITAVVMSVIGAYYYLRIIKIIYFDEEQDTLAIPEVKISFASYTLLSINSFATLVFGLMPAPILVFCATVLPY
jgi:NADH-quinone oxidoreductase subunit N